MTWVTVPVKDPILISMEPRRPFWGKDWRKAARSINVPGIYSVEIGKRVSDGTLPCNVESTVYIGETSNGHFDDVKSRKKDGTPRVLRKNGLQNRLEDIRAKIVKKYGAAYLVNRCWWTFMAFPKDISGIVLPHKLVSLEQDLTARYIDHYDRRPIFVKGPVTGKDLQKRKYSRSGDLERKYARR